MIFLGIDPGKAGCIAGVDERGAMVRCTTMPPTTADIMMELHAFKGFAQDLRCVLENVSAWAPPGSRMGATSAFTFGRGFGHLEMGLTAAEIPYDLKVPRSWQGAMQCLSGGNKNVTKARAQQLFPTLKITHANADGLLIAEYCRRLHLRIGL